MIFVVTFLHAHSFGYAQDVTKKGHPESMYSPIQGTAMCNFCTMHSILRAEAFTLVTCLPAGRFYS